MPIPEYSNYPYDLEKEAKIRRFITSTEEDGVDVYPIRELSEGITDEPCDITYCVAGFALSVNETETRIVFETVSLDKDSSKTQFLYKMMEVMPDMDSEYTGIEINLDEWGAAINKSLKTRNPVFTFTFAEHSETGEQAIFIHVAKGIPYLEAVRWFTQFASDLLGFYKILPKD
jgi:hypothetical protein